MSENKTAKTPTDSATGFIDGVWYGPWYGTAPTPISSKPLKLEWVSLTDEEIQDLSYLSQKIDEGNSPWFDRLGFARAVEAKLKERNI
jgi:hypothetical protein